MDEEKQITEEITAPEKPKRKRQPARRPAGKKSEVLDEFLKKQPASAISVPIEQFKETPKSELTNLTRETFPEVQDEEEVVDKLESIPDVYAEGEKSARQKKILKISLLTLASLLFLGLLGSAGYFYFQYKNVSKVNPADQEIKNYTAKIGKFILLPDEEPTLATVADKEKLQGQPFFANAQNGDKVLLFSKAQKAILYRPSEGKIIEVMATGSSTTLQPSENVESENNPAADAGNSQAPTNPSEEQIQAPEQSVPVKVAVYNGTNKKGLAKAIGDKVADLDGIVLSETVNAKGTYPKTIIIDLTGKNAEAIQKIIGVIGGEAGAFPDDETKPDADILIIGGSDSKTN